MSEVMDQPEGIVEDPQDRKATLEEQFEELEREQSGDEPKPERARAADGKFVSPNAEKPVLKAELILQENLQNLANGGNAGEKLAKLSDEEPTWKRPPQSWKKDVHETYGALPPAIQEYIHQREMDMQKGVGSAREKAVFADQINKAIEPFMDNIRAHAGGDVSKAVRGLMEADHLLRSSDPQKKVQLLANLAQIYGADFGQVAQLAAPHANALTAENQRLKMVVANLEAKTKEVLDTKDREDNEKLLQDVEKFRHNKPDFDDHRPRMQMLLQSGLAKDLEDAYKLAVRLDGSTAPQADPNRRQTKHQAAQAARSVAVSVKSSTPGTSTATKAQDRLSMLREQFNEQEGRL